MLVLSYNEYMARGWESKSVEEQQSQSTEPLSKEDQARQLKALNADKARSIQALKLTRARIMEQLDRSSNDRYKEMLNRELAHVDGELSTLK